MSRTILIIEDDEDIARLVKMHLEDAGFAVRTALDGTNGLELALSRSFDLIILDIMLPGVDGLEICRRVRASSAATPILMLTARSAEIDRVLGLEIGADDYLTKPFSIRELLARVKALFRRAEAQGAGAVPDDHNGHQHRRPGHRCGQAAGSCSMENRVSLTAKEFDLLSPVREASRPGLHAAGAFELRMGLRIRGLRAYGQFPHQPSCAPRSRRTRHGRGTS